MYNDNIYVTNYIHLNIKQSIINKSYSIRYNAMKLKKETLIYEDGLTIEFNCWDFEEKDTQQLKITGILYPTNNKILEAKRRLYALLLNIEKEKITNNEIKIIKLLLKDNKINQI